MKTQNKAEADSYTFFAKRVYLNVTPQGYQTWIVSWRFDGQLLPKGAIILGHDRDDLSGKIPKNVLRCANALQDMVFTGFFRFPGNYEYYAEARYNTHGFSSKKNLVGLTHEIHKIVKEKNTEIKEKRQEWLAQYQVPANIKLEDIIRDQFSDD